MERVAVIGAAGLIGGRLIDYLRDRAFWVRAVDVAGRTVRPHARANEYCQVDVREPSGAAQAVTGVGHVYVLDASLERYWPDPATGTVRDELLALSALLGAAARQGVTRLLYALPHEAAPPWGSARPMARMLLNEAAQGQVETRMALLPNIFGPATGTGDGDGPIVNRIAMAAAGMPTADAGVLPLDSEPTTLTHVADCVVALYLLMRSNHREPLAIGGERLALTEVADELSRLSLRPLASSPALRPAVFAVPTESDDLRAVFGWAPRTTVQDALEELYQQLVAGSEACHG